MSRAPVLKNHIMSVACPVCKALAGEWCAQYDTVTKDMIPTKQLHQARRRAAGEPDGLRYAVRVKKADPTPAEVAALADKLKFAHTLAGDGFYIGIARMLITGDGPT